MEVGRKQAGQLAKGRDEPAVVDGRGRLEFTYKVAEFVSTTFPTTPTIEWRSRRTLSVETLSIRRAQLFAASQKCHRQSLCRVFGDEMMGVTNGKRKTRNSRSRQQRYLRAHGMWMSSEVDGVAFRVLYYLDKENDRLDSGYQA